MTPRPLTGPLSRNWDRTPFRRQRVMHLYTYGPRMIEDLVLQASAGSPGALDQILESLSQIRQEDYIAATADRQLPADQLDGVARFKVIQGGRR